MTICMKPGIYIDGIPYPFWKQEYLDKWWMNGQDKPGFETRKDCLALFDYRKKSDWNEVDKLFKEEL